MAVVRVVAHHVPEDRPVADGHHRLGHGLRVLAQPHAQAAAEDDDLQARTSTRPCGGRRSGSTSSRVPPAVVPGGERAHRQGPGKRQARIEAGRARPPTPARRRRWPGSRSRCRPRASGNRGRSAPARRAPAGRRRRGAARVPQEGRAFGAQVHDHVQHGAAGRAHELGLTRGGVLEVHAAQRALAGCCGRRWPARRRAAGRARRTRFWQNARAKKPRSSRRGSTSTMKAPRRPVSLKITSVAPPGKLGSRRRRTIGTVRNSLSGKPRRGARISGFPREGFPRAPDGAAGAAVLTCLRRRQRFPRWAQLLSQDAGTLYEHGRRHPGGARSRWGPPAPSPSPCTGSAPRRACPPRPWPGAAALRRSRPPRRWDAGGAADAGRARRQEWRRNLGAVPRFLPGGGSSSGSGLGDPRRRAWPGRGPGVGRSRSAHVVRCSRAPLTEAVWRRKRSRPHRWRPCARERAEEGAMRSSGDARRRETGSR